MKRVVLLIVAALVFVGCSSDAKEPAVALDGSPRIPDQEGVVVSVNQKKIVLDGDRSFEIEKDIIVFSTYNSRAVALAGLRGKYVQIGVDGTKAAWVAQIGVVQGSPGSVLYEGELVRVDGRRMIFKDGTVLTLAKGLTPPAGASGRTLASLDAASHEIIGASFEPAVATPTTRPTN